MTKVDTPLVSKQYVEKTVHLLYWLGLGIAITGFFGGIIAWISEGQFVDFVMVFLSGLGIWLALIVVCCFMTLGILKVGALESGNKPKKSEEKPALPEPKPALAEPKKEAKPVEIKIEEKPVEIETEEKKDA